MGLRGEQSLSASLSGTSKSSLPFSGDLLLFVGVIGGGELAATTISASIAAQAESSSSTRWSAGGGVPGRVGSARVSGKDFEIGSRTGGNGAHASVCRLSRAAFGIRGVIDCDEVTGADLYVNFDRKSVI